jgi:hypothetical protein
MKKINPMVSLPDVGGHTEGTITMEQYWKAFDEAKDVVAVKNHCAVLDVENNDRIVLRYNNKPQHATKQ